MMPEHVDYRQLLVAYQLRVTPQRLGVLAALDSEPSHVTADTIEERLRATLPLLGKSTIYRILDDLAEVGLVNVLHLRNHMTFYELAAGPPHHHIVCDHCGRLAHLHGDILAQLRLAIESDTQFALSRQSLCLHGICAQCTDLLETQPTEAEPA